MPSLLGHFTGSTNHPTISSISWTTLSPLPALEEVGIEGGEPAARGNNGQHVFYEEQVCQPQNQLHILWLMEHCRLDSIGDTAQGGVWAQVHEGFVLGAVSPAGSLAIPAPFEFTSPCKEESHRSQNCLGGSQGRTLLTYITTDQR